MQVRDKCSRVVALQRACGEKPELFDEYYPDEYYPSGKWSAHTNVTPELRQF